MQSSRKQTQMLPTSYYHTVIAVCSVAVIVSVILIRVEASFLVPISTTTSSCSTTKGCRQASFIHTTIARIDHGRISGSSLVQLDNSRRFTNSVLIRSINLDHEQDLTTSQDNLVPVPSSSSIIGVPENNIGIHDRQVLLVPPLVVVDITSTDHQHAIAVDEHDKDTKIIGIWAARGILVLVAAIWGTNFACVKYLNNLCFHPPCNHPPSEFAFARFGLAALVSLPLLFRQRWDIILAGFECGLWITLGYFSQSMALKYISAGECAFICSLTVVFVPIMAFLLYRRPILPINVVAAVVALSGVGILEGMFDFNALFGITPATAAEATLSTANVDSSSLLSTASMNSAATGPLSALAATLGINKGNILALGQPLGFGYSFLRIEQYQEQFRDVPGRALTIAAAECVMVGAMAFLWVLYDYDFIIPNFGYMIEWHRIATIAWTGIVTTLVAIYLQGLALQRASATEAAITFSSEPVWASVFAFFLLHEQLGLDAYIGGTVILIACVLGAIGDLDGSHTRHEESSVSNEEKYDNR